MAAARADAFRSSPPHQMGTDVEPARDAPTAPDDGSGDVTRVYRPNLDDLLLRFTQDQPAQSSPPDARGAVSKGSSPPTELEATAPASASSSPAKSSSTTPTTRPPPRVAVTTSTTPTSRPPSWVAATQPQRSDPTGATTNAVGIPGHRSDQDPAEDAGDERTVLYVRPEASLDVRPEASLDVRPEATQLPSSIAVAGVGTAAPDDFTRIARPQASTENRDSPRPLDTRDPTALLPRRRKRSGVPYVLSGVLIVLGACVWSYREPIRKQLAPLAASLTRQLASGSQVRDGADTASSRPSINIWIKVSPATARLTLDGALVPNPVVLRRSSDGQEHVLSAEAAGYMPLRRAYRFDRDIIGVLSLAPAGAESPTPDARREGTAERDGEG